MNEQDKKFDEELNAFERTLTEYRNKKKPIQEPLSLPKKIPPPIEEKEKNRGLTKVKRWFSTKEKALMYDTDGEYICSIDLKPAQRIFSYGQKTYNVDRNKASKILISKLLDKETYYFYNVENCDPLVLTTPVVASALSPEEYYIELRTEMLRKLNALSNDFLSGLDFKKVLIGLGVVAVIVYFVSGGTIQ